MRIVTTKNGVNIYEFKKGDKVMFRSEEETLKLVEAYACYDNRIMTVIDSHNVRSREYLEVITPSGIKHDLFSCRFVPVFYSPKEVIE